MYHPTKFWDNTKNQPDLWFFYGFLFTFTLTIRKVLLFYPIQKKFNEYSGIYLYLSDIFLFLMLIFWVFSILCNKYINLSIQDSRKVFFVDAIKKTFYKWYLVTPLFLVALSFLSTAWAQNQPIALFRSIKFLELYLLYTYIIHKMSTCIRKDERNPFLQDLCKIIIIIGVFQSITAIGQFIIQHSLGIFWLKESPISPSIPGVAKIIFDGEKIIRAYGLFPHPNMLGGFLLFSIVLTYYYNKLFHVEHFYLKTSSPWKGEGREGIEKDSMLINNTSTLQSSPYPLLTKEGRETSCSTWNNLVRKVLKNASTLGIIVPCLPANVPRGTIWRLIMAIQIIALLLTFSKSAIIALLIAFIYTNICNIKYKRIQNVPSYAGGRGTFLSRTLLKIALFLPTDKKSGTIFKLIFLCGLTTLLLIIALTKLDVNSFFLRSLNERIEYLNVSRGTILDNPVMGLGFGQFVLSMQNYSLIKLQIWQFQPVHNVFLLIWSELGLVGLGLIVVFLLKMFHVEHFKQVANQNCSTWNNLSKLQIKNVPRGTILLPQHQKSLLNTLSKAILLGFIFIMLFDHYFWDIHQGQIILWITLGLVAGTSQKSGREPVR